MQPQTLQIAMWLSPRAEDPAQPEAWPKTFHASLQLASALRYGENPHQRGALYVEAGAGEGIVATARFLQGKELSYNNLADADAATRLEAKLRDGSERKVATRASVFSYPAMSAIGSAAYLRARSRNQ